jgi:hypothetical protein
MIRFKGSHLAFIVLLFAELVLAAVLRGRTTTV